VVCGDSGECYQEVHSNSAVTKAFEAVADRMAELV